MKTYSPAPSADGCIAQVRDDYHPDLEGVTVSALFVFDSESSEPVLKHQGYPAQAIVRITPVRDRALGMADAVIVIERSSYLTLSQRQRDALLDHELTHLTRALDPETQRPVFDVLDRPKLKMRRHDFQLGWFNEVAQRHADASAEVRQAKQLMESAGQLYFDFRWTAKQTPQTDPNMHIWWHHGTSGEAWQGKRSEMPPGCVEIDPPANSRSDLLQQAAEAERSA
jgi:Putative phage metallopeptidase